MQRTYHPVKDSIFKLHGMLEHLVCQVWCNASNENTCDSLLNKEFETVYLAYPWLKNDTDTVYEKCKILTGQERANIREAFYINNQIEKLCAGEVKPIKLDSLPEVVEDYILPLLRKFYKPLLDSAEVPGNKLDYYNKLIGANDYKTCPCCGLVKIESAESHYVEDNDHFFPIAHYPFAAVNFKNLVPVCDKCNKKHKGAKKPLDHNGLAYYAFDISHEPIETTIDFVDSDELDYLNLKKKDLILSFSNDATKNETWNWLFNIVERYNQEVRDLSYNELRLIKRLFSFSGDKTYNEILDFSIANNEIDKYDEKKFLRASFLKTIKSRPEWQAVYQPR